MFLFQKQLEYYRNGKIVENEMHINYYKVPNVKMESCYKKYFAEKAIL